MTISNFRGRLGVMWPLVLVPLVAALVVFGYAATRTAAETVHANAGPSASYVYDSLTANAPAFASTETPRALAGSTEGTGASTFVAPSSFLFVSVVGAETGGSTGDLLSGLASKAQATVGEGSGAVYGTAVHSEFAAEINALGDSNLSTEVSYLNGEVVPYGTARSVRLDVVEGDILEPQAAYDLKTGSAILTPARIAQIQANLPEGYQDIPVYEVRP